MVVKTKIEIEKEMNAIAAAKIFTTEMSTIRKEYTKLKDRALYGDHEKLSEAEKNIIKLYEERLIPAVMKTAKLSIKVKAQKEGWYEKNKDQIKKYLADLEKTFSPLNQHRIEKKRQKVDILCPACKTKLIYVKSLPYETLNEHVCAPNGYISVKDGYGCPNKECKAHTYGLTWLSDGEGPYGLDSDKVTFIDDNSAPFKTWHRKYNAEKPTEACRVWIGKFLLVAETSTKADYNGKKSLLKKSINLKLYINGMLYMPGINMLCFSLRQYIRSSNRLYIFKNSIQRINSWDKRWWSRLSLWIARHIWKKDYEKALSDLRAKNIKV